MSYLQLLHIASSEFNLLILTLGQFFINLGIPMHALS